MGQKKKLINNSGIPDHEIEKIARCLLPELQTFYESEEGQKEFAEWKKKRDAEQRRTATPA